MYSLILDDTIIDNLSFDEACKQVRDKFSSVTIGTFNQNVFICIDKNSKEIVAEIRPTKRARIKKRG